MGRTACTEPQCLYKGALYLYLTVELYLYSPYGLYGLYRASVPVQGYTLPFFTMRIACRTTKAKDTHTPNMYRCADKSLARPGIKQANVSVRMASISFGALPCKKKKIDDSSRLDVVEIARVPDMLPSLFLSWSG